MQKVYSTLINSCDLLSKSYLQQRKVNSNAQFRGCDLLSKSYLQQLRWQIKKEVNIEHQYPDTLTNIKPNWAKINDTYQLIQLKDSVFQPIGFYLEKDDNGDDLLFSKAGPVLLVILLCLDRKCYVFCKNYPIRGLIIPNTLR